MNSDFVAEILRATASLRAGDQAGVLRSIGIRIGTVSKPPPIPQAAPA